jgi:hypothetical protein
VSFTFLGYTFRPRSAQRKDGVVFTAFLPAVNRDALKKMSAVVRSWRLHRRVNSTEAELAREINPIVQGWMACYGAFYHTELTPVLDRINTYLLRWIMKKYRDREPCERPARRWHRPPPGAPGTSHTGSG